VSGWYNIPTAEEGNLVLGMYPLRFLMEAAKKFGAIIFNISAPRAQIGISIQTTMAKEDLLGTRLPFSKHRGWLSGVRMLVREGHIDRCDHPTTTQWKIRIDGSIHPQSVGITFTSEDTSTKIIPGTLVVSDASRNNTMRFVSSEVIQTPNIHKSLKELNPTQCIYGIELYEDYGMRNGILLQRLRYSISGEYYFLKVGDYAVGSDFRVPASTDVDWVVL
jgi:hypothetical protein